MTWLRNPRVFLAPGMVLILVAIGGRYTLDRAGLVDLAWVDLRVIGLIIALAVLAVDVARRPRGGTARRAEGWLVVTTFFFLFQIASGLWAPQAARVGPQTLDLCLMAALTIAFYLYTVGDPATVIRTSFLLFFIAAIIFALAAIFINGPGDQGRYSAFGGGPNVFVRIEILGIISAVALYQFTHRILPLLVVPLFVLAAILSGSRAGLLAGAAVGAAALFRSRHRLRTGPVVAAVVVLVAAGIVVWSFAPPSFTSLFQDRFVEQTVQQHYLSDRTSIWQAAWGLAVDHPLLGAGLDGFYGLIGVNQGVEYPHNYVLGVAAEGGLVGIGLLTMAILLWIGTIRRNTGHPQLTGLATAAAVFVALSSLFSGDYYDARLAWLFAAMAAAAAVTRPVPAADPAVPAVNLAEPGLSSAGPTIASAEPPVSPAEPADPAGPAREPVER